jgi:hypothetical protein
MTTDFRALCAELLTWAERTSAHYVAPPDVIIRARAALAAPEQGPTDEELDSLLYYEFTTSTGHGERTDPIGFARAVLARWGRPVVEPVPVSERLPGPEDCDAKGRCWLLNRPLLYDLGAEASRWRTAEPVHRLGSPLGAAGAGGWGRWLTSDISSG